jgi:hypothetical protein
MNEIFSSPLIINIVYVFHVAWLLYSLYLIREVANPSTRPYVNYYIYESIPSIFVTVGLFGTCLGITLGLLKFDVNPSNIKQSVEMLLEGLKGAFITTVVGLFLSLIFKKIVHYQLNKYSDLQPPVSPEFEVLLSMNINIQKMGDTIATSFEQKFDVFIEDMRKTNKDLADNLNNFAEQLAETNQDALTEALQEIVEDLNSGFKEHLQALVRANFSELTDSVNSLNSWQREHKEQVTVLSHRYTKVVNDTEKMNMSLESIISKTDKLIGQGSQLQKVIDTLNSVIVEDERYKDLVNKLNTSTQNLQNASKLYENNLVVVKELSKSIDDWFKGEHSLTGSIALLHKQIDAIKEVVGEVPLYKSSLNRTFGQLDQILKEYLIAIPKHIETQIKEIEKKK